MNKTPIEASPQITYFFDDAPKTVFELQNPAYKHEKDLNTPPLLVESLKCKNLSTGVVIEGKFALHSKILAYYKAEISTSPEYILEVICARLKAIPSDENNPVLGLVLSKNGNNFEFYFNEKQALDNWMNALKCICILPNFHEEYKATKMIGKGSFAKVYLVDAKTTGKNYAVKAFHKEGLLQTNAAKARETMLNEIDLMRDLDHDNIIKLHEVYETERSIYLVMELIQGKPLQEPLTRQTFKRDYSQAHIAEMIRSLLDTLAYLASKGIMHRDLKPDNILVDKTGKLKVIDFGLATYIDLPDYIFKKCGTPGYIAPEVFKYDSKVESTFYDDHCDVYSVGCIAFYMLFGTPFFDANDAKEILRMNRELTAFDHIYILTKEKKDPNSKINKEGINLLTQLLEYDHKKRITAAQALTHPYFSTTLNNTQKPSSSKELVDSPKHSLNDISSPTAIKKIEFVSSVHSDKGSPNATSGNRYAEKDSLYLDLGKPEMNGKLNTLTNNSVNNSINMKGGPQVNSNNNSLSVFANKQGTPDQEGKSPSRAGYKGGYATGNQSFLKAAIFNNMQKNHDMSDSPVRKDEALNFQAKIERRNTDNFTIKTSKLQNNEGFNSSPGSATSDGEDLGGENCKIRMNFEKMKEDAEKNDQVKALEKQDNDKPIIH